MIPDKKSVDRNIAALAFPALGALIAEPLFLAVDSALVGHLGAVPLAGLAIASAILTTAIGLMIFLAYSTTPLVARRRGSGDLRGASQAGVDGLWLAFGLGIIVAGTIYLLSRPLVATFGADAAVAENALSYLTISTLGMPAMLIVFAASGLLRGMQDTMTPLIVATIGFTANALLNWLFIYGMGLGIAGSAIGTVIAQWGMVLVYLYVISKIVKKHGARFLPERDGFKEAGRSGSWLFIRTLGLRIALLATVFAATSHGAAATAGYQIIFTLLSITAFGLDALAIAAQALVGDALGGRNAERARFVLNRSIFWSILVGTAVGLILIALSPFIGLIFTSDKDVLTLLVPSIIAVGATLPLGGIVYVLDGVLMGAGDAKYLAIVSLATLPVYLPVLWLTTVVFPSGATALVALTLAFALFLMLLRAITLGVRARGDKWMILGPRAL